MRTMSVSELKTHFLEVLKSVEEGEKIAITDGPKKDIKALLIPNTSIMAKRNLGLLKGIASLKIAKDFKISEEEFVEIFLHNSLLAIFYIFKIMIHTY